MSSAKVTNLFSLLLAVFLTGSFFLPTGSSGQESTPPPAAPEPEKEGPENVRRRPDGSRFRRNRGALNRARLPEGIFGDDVISPLPTETLLGGSVPAIWEIDRTNPQMEDALIPDLLDRDTSVPPVPGKVIRYADRFLKQHDKNGDGVLRQEEWSNLPGAPQAIDTDGDSIITLEELVQFLAKYGRNRTIHNPNPVETAFFRPSVSGSQFQYFKPVTVAPPDLKEQEKSVPDESGDDAEPEKKNAAYDTSQDMTDDLLEENDTLIDDAVYEEIISGRQTPARKKYHVPKEQLRGVPVWFLIRDADGDGQVSMSEFAPGLNPKSLALFKRLDKNTDGFITPDEVRKPLPSEETPGPE